ncbi:hypothetical protein K435DRAFT_857729 [Dendrothele bispora CBS 962.96]|uniref:Uncharacterized protein n=1 Tax=Dendrothele bispora (strain CBS 962.96) TaxID=1314807 RepID=A0A4S8M5J1_DENBC|nr:hypothetical protein K435DRAFT_857729 [Dendrothele bispora CBS 962.96]
MPIAIAISKESEFLHRAYPYLFPSYRPKSSQWHKKVKDVRQRRLSRSIPGGGKGVRYSTASAVFSTSPLTQSDSLSEPLSLPYHANISTTSTLTTSMAGQPTVKKPLPSLPAPTPPTKTNVNPCSAPIVEQNVVPPPPAAKLKFHYVSDRTGSSNGDCQERRLPAIPRENRTYSAPLESSEQDIADIGLSIQGPPGIPRPSPPLPPKERHTSGEYIYTNSHSYQPGVPIPSRLFLLGLDKQVKVELAVHDRFKQSQAPSPLPPPNSSSNSNTSRHAYAYSTGPHICHSPPPLPPPPPAAAITGRSVHKLADDTSCSHRVVSPNFVNMPQAGVVTTGGKPSATVSSTAAVQVPVYPRQVNEASITAVPENSLAPVPRSPHVHFSQQDTPSTACSVDSGVVGSHSHATTKTKGGMNLKVPGHLDEEMVYPPSGHAAANGGNATSNASTDSHSTFCGLSTGLSVLNPTTTWMVNFRAFSAIMATAFLVLMTFFANL